MKEIDDFIAEKEYIIRRVLHIHFMPAHICSKYRIELDDLMQVGRIALWEASKKFRPKENGTSFDTYAHRIINFRLLSYLGHLNRPIRQLDYSSSIFAEMGRDMELLDVIPSEINVEELVNESLYIEAMASALKGYEEVVFKQRLLNHTYVDIQNEIGVKGKNFSIIRGRMEKKVRKVHENAI